MDVVKIIKKITKKADSEQQKLPALAFPIAVVKRYGDEKVGKQAALLTYYAFLSIFPLLMAFITVIGIIVSGDPELQAKINNEVFQYFPALGNDLQGNVHSLKSSGLALLLELIILIYGARGLAVSLQDAFNYIWHSDQDHDAGFLHNNLRSLAMLVAMGVGLLLGITLSYILSAVLNVSTATTICITIVNALFTIGLLLAVFRLGTSGRVKTQNLVLGAILAGIALVIVQHFGGYIMSHELPKLRGAYGSFALTLAMMFWIYLQAQIIMYAVVATAVRSQRDWPKQLFE